MKRWLFGLLPLVAAGCGIENELTKPLPFWPPSDPPPVADTEQEDVIVQVTIPIVDVLFVIDNSCSMDDEQAALAASFPGFIGYFIGSGLQWHVGVTSTDLDNPLHQGKLQSAQGSLFIQEGPDEVSTPDPEGVFAEMAALGTTGTGEEKGLGATYLALAGDDDGWRDTYNAGFYRDEASITTIVISDESDQTADSQITKKEFIEWYNALKLKSNERTFSSIVSMSSGTRYLDVTDEIGGTAWDITDSDWDRVLDYLGVQASGLKQEFFLSQLPVVSTLEVEVIDPLGNVLPQVREVVNVDDPSPGSSYRYVEGRNSVEFYEFIPEPLSQVVMRYTLLSSAQDPNAAVVATDSQ